MNPNNADQVVLGSAIVVAGVFVYTAWQGDEKLSIGEFATAWGVVYLTLALIASVSPKGAAALALLIMVSDLLTNLPSLSRLLKTQENTTTAPSASSSIQGTLATPAPKGGSK